MSLLSRLFASGRSSSSDSVDVASPEFKANPYNFYAQLRAHAPVHRMESLKGEPGWLITRYDDVVMVLTDERFVKNRRNARTPEESRREPWFRKLRVFKSLEQNMLDLDPPDHTRLRALVGKAFTPGLIEQLRTRIHRLTEELLDKVQDRGSMDLISDYALPLPTTIIAEILGVPVEDRHKFHRWSNAMTRVSSPWGMLMAIPSALAFFRYIRSIIVKRRANSQDDLVSALIRAEEAGDKLSEDELVAMVFLLLVAGHETTVNLIGNSMLALLEHPEQMKKLRNDPELVRPAIEELLRFTSPVEMATERYAREDVTIADVSIPRGSVVFAVIASANRDQRHFTNPDTLDIAREPNRHLSFGLGPHYCLGAPLARLEGQIAINTLLHRIPDLRLAVKQSSLRWRPGLVLRGLRSLPMAFGLTNPR